MEKHAARLIKQFIQSDRSHEKRRKLVQVLAEILQEAHDLGVQFGQEMIATRAIGSIDTGRILQKAKDIVSGIVDRIRDLFGSGGDEQSAVDTLPELIAETEIPAMVESAVMDVLQDGGVTMIEWVDNPDACEMCVINAAASPLVIGSAWPSGHEQPPAHPRCRCSIMPVEDV